MAPHADYGAVMPSSTNTLSDPRSLPTASRTTSRTHLTEGLNIIVPMGGIGSRFQREGYRFPKPLIKIVGRPMLYWLVERLGITSQDTLWLAVNEEIENEFQIGQLMKKSFPNLDTRILRLPYLTRGAAETLYIVTQAMPVSHRRRRTISLDCDTIYHNDILSEVRALPPGVGACFYFTDLGEQPIFSYIELGDDGIITDIQEKKAISRHANTGAYVFPNATQLQQWANRVLDSKLEPSDENVGEYFSSQIIDLMIKEGNVSFMGIEVLNDAFSCVGTPNQLEEFLLRIQQEDTHIKPMKQRFCFDLDGTLVGSPEVAGDYSTCPPLQDNIELVQSLHRAGHYIIIQTARRMRTHKGNIGAVIADIGAVTIASLARWKIPYDEIVFGKPYAHIYVDDLAVNANLDTRRELGWLGTDAANKTANALTELKSARKAGILPSRDFNHIQIIGQKVQKSSRSSKLLAEMYFYSHCPTDIADLFPTMHTASFFAETGTYTFTMAKLEGITYSHLLTARSLTAGRLNIMLRSLHRIHNAGSVTACSAVVGDDVKAMFTKRSVDDTPARVDVYANYAPKVRARFHEHRATYAALGLPEMTRVFNLLVDRLEAYSHDGNAVVANVIHGDPVFSNILLNEPERRVSFLDVRSQLGDALTMVGDVAYDLAKILQSLQGYDYVILTDDDKLEQATRSGRGIGMIITPEDRSCLQALQRIFWEFVDTTYEGRIRRQDLLTITVSLLFSLIPLHRPIRQPFFMEMCINLLEYDTVCPV